MYGGHATAAGARARRAAKAGGVAGMNVLVFLTDQQRAVQHFPRGWSERNMPGLTRLQRHGMTFDNACTNACMCSPSRSTLMSGYFPAQHGVKYTLETDMPARQYPQVELATSLKNPASVVAAAGYTPGLQGQVPLQQAGQRLHLGARRTSTSTASPAGIRRTPAPTRTPASRAAGATTTTGAS